MIPMPREYFMRKVDVGGMDAFRDNDRSNEMDETGRREEAEVAISRPGENEEREITGPTGKQRPSPEEKFMKIYS